MEVLGIVFLATFVEGFITYLRGNSEKSTPWLKYVALALGVVVAVGYNIDIPAMVGIASGYPLVSNVISGIIIGRGSNYVNDLLQTVTAR